MQLEDIRVFMVVSIKRSFNLYKMQLEVLPVRVYHEQQSSFNLYKMQLEVIYWVSFR